MKILITVIGAMLVSTSSASPRTPPDSQTINIRAYVDGRSRLILDADTAQWHHYDHAAPGRHGCSTVGIDEPTFINGVPWFPQWPDLPDCSNAHCDCDSDIFIGMQPALPDGPYTVSLDIVACREQCSIVELPTQANGYRVVVEFNDNGTGGAEWYEVNVDFCPPPVTNYCTANPNSSGSPAWIGATGSHIIADNNLTLHGFQVAPNQFGYFLMSATEDFVPLFAGSHGNLCLGAPIIRFNIAPQGQVLFSGPQGEMTFSPDLMNLPQGVVFQHGETWRFQLWFRDVVGPVFTSNTTDGLRILFQ